MTEHVPALRDLIGATFDAVKRLGGRASNQQIVDEVTRDLRLPPAVVAVPHGTTSKSELEYRLAWARTYLRNHGLLNKEGRGAWSLTPAGGLVTQLDPREVIRAADQRKRASRASRARTATTDQATQPDAERARDD